MHDEMAFGPWLKHRRRSLVLTQDELARRLGYSIVTVRKVEADNLRPSHALAQKLAEVLDIPQHQRAAFVAFARREQGVAGDSLSDTFRAAATAPAAARAVPLALPSPLTPLVDRLTEVERISAMLSGTSRLITLTGAGGAGKTRLAIEAARRLSGATMGGEGGKGAASPFRDGVLFVNLAPASDSASLVSAIAQSLGLRQEGTDSLFAAIKDYLARKRLLFVLDTFEHLAEAASVIAELLAAAPDVKVLITSRRPLHLGGEFEYLVPPLASPDPGVDLQAARLLGYPAVELFRQRAVSVVPDFAVDDGNGRAVAEICGRLDGLPLAIELAAARVKILRPESLLSHLGRPLQLLAGNRRDIPERQQTMRSAIEWSYRLLSADERRLFCRLGIFAGGCSLEAVEAVCNLDGALPGDLLDVLSSLVDQSMLQVDTSAGEPRFQMLQTLHEYAVEQLEAGNEAGALHCAHARFYLALTADIDPRERGPELVMHFRRLTAEQDNLRSALRWSFGDGGEPEWGVRLAARLSGIWEFYGDISEGRRWIEAALAVPADRIPVEARAAALYGGGTLAFRQGDHETALALLEDYLAMAQALDDRPGVAYALLALGNVALGLGNLPLVSEHIQASLGLFQELGIQIGVGMALGDLGFAAFFQGDLPLARALQGQAAEIFESLRSPFHIGIARSALGWVALGSGDLEQARTLLVESVQRLGGLGEKRFLLYSIYGLAGVALAAGRLTRAACLLGAVETLRIAAQMRLGPAVDQIVDDLKARTQAMLPAPSYLAEWQQGREMTIARILAYACEPASAQ